MVAALRCGGRDGAKYTKQTGCLSSHTILDDAVGGSAKPRVMAALSARPYVLGEQAASPPRCEDLPGAR